MRAMTDTAAPPTRTRWTAQWKELYEEVITSGLCTGCAGCVISCPHEVIGYDHVQGGYKPFHLEDELGASDCTHGQKGCTTCTRACPRYQHWEDQADEHLFGRTRETDELSGIYSDILLTRAADDGVHEAGQDGGLVSAMLLWLLEEKYIDGALVSYLEGDGSTWMAKPGVATTPEEIMASAGSRYTYSANTLALTEAMERGLKDLALVGMSCQSSVPPVMWTRKAGKIGKPIKFNIGLLCSKTFDDAIFEELFEAKYGLTRAMIKKVNIKGVFQIWTHDGEYHEVPAQGVPRLDPRGLQPLPRLRRRARRHLHRRHRQVQRLDPDGRPHRPGPRGHRAHGRGPAASRPAPATTTPAPSR